MTESNMFEQASRMKVRFNTTKGSLSVEDLWDLPLVSKSVSLDQIARDLYRELRETSEVSFVLEKTKETEEIELKFNLVKHIIDVKLAERKAKEDRAINQEKIRHIDEILRLKEEDELKGKSVEDLKKMRQELGLS